MENKFEQWLKQHPEASLWDCYAANHDVFDDMGTPELTAWLKTLSEQELCTLTQVMLYKAHNLSYMADKIYRFMVKYKAADRFEKVMDKYKEEDK